ncbi:MAG: superoxide dismutase family protein [Ruminococcaceae bacterium]|nr:superoxide dismutase family protein [Oscillospiraceae bacterium]
MYGNSNEKSLASILRRLPDAVAVISGSPEYSSVYGTVKFYRVMRGVLVAADVVGLPTSVGECKSNIFAFHIHGGVSCTGNSEDRFADAGTHYDPHGCPHPYHAGDMPPLFSTGGQAFLAFLTDRFTVEEIMGKTVVIHDSPDDFTTQPSGNAGKKIACGVISGVRR